MNLGALAEERTALHAGHASQRVLSPNHDRVGLVGEAEFGRVFGQRVDTEARPGGDRGRDFSLLLRFSVDVKTFRKPFNLLVEAGKVHADIYVLAEYDDSTDAAKLVGWTYATTLRRSRPRDFGFGILNHYVPREKLRPIAELLERVSP